MARRQFITNNGSRYISIDKSLANDEKAVLNSAKFHSSEIGRASCRERV